MIRTNLHVFLGRISREESNLSVLRSSNRSTITFRRMRQVKQPSLLRKPLGFLSGDPGELAVLSFDVTPSLAITIFLRSSLFKLQRVDVNDLFKEDNITLDLKDLVIRCRRCLTDGGGGRQLGDAACYLKVRCQPALKIRSVPSFQ